jgi:hypothetical protein
MAIPESTTLMKSYGGSSASNKSKHESGLWEQTTSNLSSAEGWVFIGAILGTFVVLDLVVGRMEAGQDNVLGIF